MVGITLDEGDTGRGKERGFWNADNALDVDLIASDTREFIQ